MKCNFSLDSAQEAIMEYKGQEKVIVKSGQFKGVYGYIRMLTANEQLWLFLDNGHKTSIHKDEVEFIHSNYFLENMNNYLSKIKKENEGD